jgi:hypothetical protein
MKTTVLPQPPYSPDLALADYFLFPKLKSTFIERLFKRLRKFADGATRVPEKRRTRTVSRSHNGVRSDASIQEGSTLKAIRLTQLQACPKKL